MSDSKEIIEPAVVIPPLHCTICTTEIDAKRARRQTATCSETCKNQLDQVRIEQRRSKKCPVCLNPSTPEERQLFRIWRAERGDIRSAEPAKHDKGIGYRRELDRALRAAVALLEGERNNILASACTKHGDEYDFTSMDIGLKPHYDRLASGIERFKKLIDTKGAD